MCVSKDFTGGNIRILKRVANIFSLNNELRDSKDDWFYWAFCLNGLKGETYKFIFPENRIGYFGPAVSHDLINWEWLGKCDDDNTFSYTIKENENKIYFAHSMLYHPERFLCFAKKKGLAVKELCKSKKGRSVPFTEFGNGKKTVLLTARHHACESSGSYVLEGIINRLLSAPLKDSKVIVIPFVDFDGVVDGDQGKGRIPHDHNRDYDLNLPAIYPETNAIRKLASGGIDYAFDFHSPWHKGGENDNVFIVEKRHEKLKDYNRFGKLLEKHNSENSLKYSSENNLAPDVSWNSSKTKCFATFANDYGSARLSFSLECTYFGKNENVFLPQKAIEFGRCFADALKEFDNAE